MKFLAQLQNPPREFTAIPFWFLNGELTAEELRRQLADFAAHGIYGVVLHPRMGLSPDITYLGERYFAHIRTAVEAAAALDMKIVLYDEGMYPSGSASGLVVKDHPELASEGITLTQTVLPGDELLAQAESGTLVVRKSGGTMRGLHWGEDDGEKKAPKTADILNPAAVSRFIELTHEAYYRELKEYFGAAIIGFFTDEPSILGRNVSGMFPWTHGFAEIFRRAGGNAANLTALFDGRENDDTRLYHKLLLQREGEVYYDTLSRWCEAHGIGLMGHPHQSDDIEVEKYFAVPGQDLVLRWLAPEKDGLAGIDSTMAKCSADAARLMHRRRNANECFGACNKDDNPWQLSGGDIKWYTDWLAVRGVNLFIPHAFYYSICGKRKDERPPDVGPHSIWWAHYEAWSTYWRRLSWLMTDIDLHAEAAVLCRNRDLCPDTVRPLFERQIGFQYIPESYFPACTVEDGALCLHGHRYTAVLGDKALFPDAAHPEVSALEPDCRCDPPQPMLRCASFNKEGRACWLLVNEGNTPIKTRLTLPVDAPLCRYDLWSGQPCACPAERTAKGACLPLELPGLVGSREGAIAPIVSSARAAKLILRRWAKEFGRTADFVVIEGCKAGGHLGFAEDDLLAGKCQTLDDILPEVLAEVKPYEAQFGHSIPVFVAGGVYTGADLAHFTAMGAAGVQLATRFITTYECDASQGYKDVLLNARPEDVRIIHSPVGMPGRALNTPLVQALAEGTRFPPRHCARCLKTCDPAKVPYCITHALIEAVKGNVEEGLFFCGANVGRLDRMYTVRELMDELVTEWRQNR